MKFRIEKENGIYYAEYKRGFLWFFVDNSASDNIEKTREACRQFVKASKKPKTIEVFEL